MRDPNLTVCPKCGGLDFHKEFASQVNIRPPADSGWQLENGGKGRWFPQLGRRSDPKSYARSRNEAAEAARVRGQRLERD